MNVIPQFLSGDEYVDLITEVSDLAFQDGHGLRVYQGNHPRNGKVIIVQDRGSSGAVMIREDLGAEFQEMLDALEAA